MKEDYPLLPSYLEKYVEAPYGGLFGKSVLVDVLEEIVADPYRNYRPKDLEEIINASSPSIRKSLGLLTSIEILKKDMGNQKHPVYRANINSKRLMALTFLSYSILDDRDGSSCMDEAIIDYCYRFGLIHKIIPLAEATITKYTVTTIATVSTVSVKLKKDKQSQENEEQAFNYISAQ